jgi:hypothetical protein
MVMTKTERRRPAKLRYVAETRKPSSKLPAGVIGACTIYRANVATLLGGQC